MGYKDADATLTSPMLLGVCDGVSQLEEYGMDPALLPHELLRTCEELAMTQLVPDGPTNPQDRYRGPISLLKEAYEATESKGSTTVLLGALDNSTKIHGKLHPMIAVLSIGDCELLMLRRTQGRQSPFQAVFHTEMQRIDHNVQTPLQLARVDGRIDADFDESIALEVIEKGSAVHCVSAYEGDLVVMGSDGVFDNLFLDEIVEICNANLPTPRSPLFDPAPPNILAQVAQKIVLAAHKKSSDGGTGQFPDTPIGKGGKVDDTSVVVAEIVEWTEAHQEIWHQVRRSKDWGNMLNCGGHPCHTCQYDDDEDDYARLPRGNYRGAEEYAEMGEDEEKCAIL
jgi:protein phosphatase PTC7